MKRSPVVYVIDDDPDVRESLRLLLESVDLEAEVFGSADAFLTRSRAGLSLPGCLLLDMRMPGMSGMSLLEQLTEEGAQLPTIVITGHGDIPMAVKAMKLGAVDFVTKPYNHQELLDLVQDVLRRENSRPEPRMDPQEAQALWQALTPREQEIFERIVRGESNKVIAYDLDISIRTVETHRARIMQKMNARTLVDLVLMSVELKSPD